MPSQSSPIFGTFFNLTGKSVYSLEKYYTNGTDSKGHYERIRIRVTPSTDAMVAKIVSEVPEYSSAEDFIRDAILHRLMYFHTSGIPVNEANLKRELHESEMASQRALMAAQESYVENCNATVSMAIDVGDWLMLADIISEMEDQFQSGHYPQGTQAKLGEAIEEAWRRMASGRSSRADRRKVTGQD